MSQRLPQSEHPPKGSVLLEFLLAVLLFFIAIAGQVHTLRQWHLRLVELDDKRLPYEGVRRFPLP
jgi:hypothetical protein